MKRALDKGTILIPEIVKIDKTQDLVNMTMLKVSPQN